MCVRLCMWMGDQRRELSVARRTILSILERRPCKELCLHEPARLKERTKDVGRV